MTENSAKRKKLTRRDFLKGGALAGAGLVLSKCLAVGDTEVPGSLAQEATPTQAVYLPLVSKEPTPTPTPTSTPTATPTATPTSTATATPTATPTTGPGTGPKVVHIYANDVTYWDFGSDYYGNYVDQDVVNEMVDRGLMELTGTSTRADAWRSLIPNYSGGVVAIKVNCNNAECNVSDTIIDALPQPVMAMVQGLQEIGVSLNNIHIYDAVRPIPVRFQRPFQNLGLGVRFFGYYYPGQSECNEEATFSDAYVDFSQSGIPEQIITDVVVQATYLINVPIMKRHPFPGVTLGFKNHFGTIHHCVDLHDYIDVYSGSHYSRTYNPMVDIYRSPHVQGKTILTLGDGLFGWAGISNATTPWETFGNQAPNSLFFSTDPVAIDCVMCDFLNAEPYYNPEEAADYLRLAADAGLGVYEQGDPWGSGYSQIDYVKVTL